MIARTTRRVAAKFGSSLRRSSLKLLRQELERLLEKVQKRSERIADLEKELADAQKKIAEQEKQITEQEKQITDQEKQITDLERQLALRKRNSTNSSKPSEEGGLEEFVEFLLRRASCRSKSPTWNDSSPCARGTPQTLPSPLPPMVWPESKDRAAASTRANGNPAASPDTQGIIAP